MIEVFADIWCPFAHVGLHMTRRRRDERAPGAGIHIRAWPLELVNGEPQSPTKAAEHVHDLRTQLGVDLFKGFNVDNFPTTSLPVLALVAAAERGGRGEEVSFGVREALWEHGRDVGAPDVVADLARQFGVAVTGADDETVRADWHEGQRRGVVGSPHFFCGASSAFCPSLVIERDAGGELHVRPDPSRLAAFLEECWP
jgi:predicted DsbA family dithiol-disulfide isomerase